MCIPKGTSLTSECCEQRGTRFFHKGVFEDTLETVDLSQIELVVNYINKIVEIFK